MTTIHLDDQTANALHTQAHALGMTLEEFLRSIAVNGKQGTNSPSELTYEQWYARLQHWITGFPMHSHVADDDRGSLYAGRDE